ILHHYAFSPYSEKIRAIFGFKKLAWKSVTIPVIMPKPDLLSLTGGYRKTPVMQIGRDVYCDTRLIAHVLDRIHPAPPLVPRPLAASCGAFVHFEPSLFSAAMGAAFQLAPAAQLMERLGGPAMLERFAKDRAALFTGGTTLRPSAEFAKAHFARHLGALDAQLSSAPFLLGAAPTLADFSMFHGLWFVLAGESVANMLDPFENVLAWLRRIGSLGRGQASDLSAAAALEIASRARESQPFEGELIEPIHAKLGQRVAINATDYGVDRIEGTLVHASSVEVAVRRTDEHAGEVTVHCPRADFKITPLE
ncbi:MAG TPA: glutathione S-transferase family protein, partial [Polyangiaceae bacterium]|nr:glutathione S-transferase family protein [Polyangiaceae bacterium]